MTEHTRPPVMEPCPFCGGEAQPALVQAGGIEWAQVECVSRGCGASGPTPATEAEAIAAWNRRTPPASQAELLSALERCAEIVERNLYRQHEKIEDVPRIARDALAKFTPNKRREREEEA